MDEKIIKNICNATKHAVIAISITIKLNDVYISSSLLQHMNGLFMLLPQLNSLIESEIK